MVKVIGSPQLETYKELINLTFYPYETSCYISISFTEFKYVILEVIYVAINRKLEF